MLAAVTILALALGPGTSPHDDLAEHLAILDAELRSDPTDAAAWLDRAGLLRRARRWDEALGDLEHALALGAPIESGGELRAALCVDAGWWSAARDALALLGPPRTDEDGRARARAWARVLEGLGEEAAAAGAFARVWEGAPPPGPDDVLEHARLVAGSRPTGRDLVAAVEVLERGITELGPLLALQTKAIELERRAGRPGSALARVDAVLATVHRRERWLVLRGEILVELGRPVEARRDWRAALAAVADLSPRQRGTRAVRALEDRLRDLLRPVPSPEPDATNTDPRATRSPVVRGGRGTVHLHPPKE